MKHYTLTKADEHICMRQNAKAGFGFTEDQLKYLLKRHEQAYVENSGLDFRHEDKIYKNERRIAMIEERLTDANFHSFAALLHNHKYHEAKTWIKEDM